MGNGMIRRWIFWFFGLVCAGALYLFGNNAGTFVIFAATAVLPLLSGLFLIAAAKLSRFQSAFDLPNFCAKDEEIQGFLTVIVKGSLLINYSCRLLCENINTGEQTQTTLNFEADRRHETSFEFYIQPLFSGDLLIDRKSTRLNSSH